MIKLVNQCEPLDSRFVLGFVSLKGAGGGAGIPHLRTWYLRLRAAAETQMPPAPDAP